MEEKTFFEHDGVKVTSARFVVDGQTFAMSNVTSVKALEEPPGRLWTLLGAVLAFGLMTKSILLGAIVLGLAIWYFVKQPSKFHIMLRTSGGETKALTTNQKEYVEKVVGALSDAIVHRG
jgi:hypothetical protein